MTAQIEWDKIAQLLWAAPLAALAVSITFATLILSLSRAADARRAHASVQAASYSALAVASGIAFAAIVVLGIDIIATT
jgi:hypothetical protein